MQIVNAAYTGNGVDGRVFTGIPFQPSMVLIYEVSGAQGIIWRTSAMAGDLSLDMVSGWSAGSTYANMIQSITSDGFTVGTDTSVNNNLAQYYYTAFSADATMLEVGTYTGNGVDARDISTGIAVSFVGVQYGDTGTPASRPLHWKNEHLAGDAAWQFGSTSVAAANFIQAVGGASFQVGNEVNVNQDTRTYYYFVFKEVTGNIYVSNYTGNDVDDRDIVQADAFQPGLVWIRGNDVVNGRISFKTTAMDAGDNTFVLGLGYNQANYVQAFNTDGFEVGTNVHVNGTAGADDTYYYLSITNVSPLSAAPPALPTVAGGGAFTFLPFSAYRRYKGVRTLTEALRNARLGP